ncbi:MAG: sugar phosphate nucleotidyltransferase [Planctomycetota bacterium]|nr:sugar phosphate nucleotidyltransferase [Planctomycetota bacterium]MDI6787686.1 sugar phosphate nucleotidyltransferase [Planctomycetota bacterium]
MKGIILAGGLGSRLYPLTKVTNKHLLPVYNKPMIYYPILTLVEAGVKDIMLVTGGNSAGDFMRLIGNGKELGLKQISYAYQEGEGGIAVALSLAEHFAGGERIVVVLGDNLIEGTIKPFVERYRRQKSGAKIILKKVPDPERFGVPVFSARPRPEKYSGSGLGGKNNKIIRIDEKPKLPQSPYAVIGIYMYDSAVFEIIKTLKPSKRGELEITDVNNAYLKSRNLTYEILEGWWTDAGTFESLSRANNLVAEKIATTDKH